MAVENDFARLIDAAPKVECPRCVIAMKLRNLAPKQDSQTYTATFRCPKCGSETQREFTVGP